MCEQITMRYRHDDENKADFIRKQTRSPVAGIPEQVYNTASPCMFCLELYKVKNPDSTCSHYHLACVSNIKRTPLYLCLLLCTNQ